MQKLKNYIGGQWIEPTGCQWLDVENPSTCEIVAQVPLSSARELDQAVEAARQAFPGWAATPADRRVEPLFKLAHLMRENMEKLSRTITTEMGKSLPDARAEMKRALENVEAACGMPILQQGDKLVAASGGIDGEVLRLPIGVFGMIPPFNFPAMVPFWFLPYAVAAGNTYVIKPSEQVPCSLQAIGELVERAGFPPGVINIVNGDRNVAEAMLAHPDIAGISFVGSSRVARIVAETCARSGKRYQALGGAKNHLVVMPDAKIDEVVRNLVTSGFGCAGQRCMASSAIVCVGDRVHDEITAKFVAASREVIVANPLDPEVADEGMVMGPVISKAAKERIEGLIATGIKEGANLVLDGRGIRVPGNNRGYFIGPTVFTGVRPGMEIHATEIFGPVQVILKADTLDQAIAIINAHEYGNGASIYTQNGYWARKFKLEAEAGMIGINVGIPAPVAYLPFGGMKASMFGDIKGQGKSVADFFTHPKVVTERYWPEG